MVKVILTRYQYGVGIAVEGEDPSLVTEQFNQLCSLYPKQTEGKPSSKSEDIYFRLLKKKQKSRKKKLSPSEMDLALRSGVSKERLLWCTKPGTTQSGWYLKDSIPPEFIALSKVTLPGENNA
jgi:hypothetical protein